MTTTGMIPNGIDHRFHGLPHPVVPASFRSWRAGVVRSGRLPIIAIAGLRGKTTIIRLLDHIIKTAGHKTALWTSTGVEINGRPQVGELGAWKEALGRVMDGDVSVAIQELEWATVLAAGLPPGFYPIVTITNLCGNDEVCLLHREAQLAHKSMPKIIAAADPNGVIVLNGEDFTLVDSMTSSPDQPAVLYSLSRMAPLLRQHLARGGMAAWRDGEVLRLGNMVPAPVAGHTPALPYALSGDATFQVTNVLAAVSTARMMGIPLETIEMAIESYDPPARRMLGTFSVFSLDGVRIVIDRASPSWALRPVLRALRTHARGRLIAAIGKMEGVSIADVEEVGRMIGRDADALVLHNHQVNPDRVSSFLQGVTRAFNPPVVLRVSSEGRAIGAVLRRAKPRDTVLILADDPLKAYQAVQRAIRLAAPVVPAHQPELPIAP